MCTNLSASVVAPETHQNSLCELNIKLNCELLSHHTRICIVGGYMEDLTNHRTVKIGGWALARGWVLAQDNIVICSF